MKKETLKLFFKPLTVVNKVLNKDKNLVFFYTNLGFRDNVKELYDYMITNNLNKRYKIVLSVNEPEAIKKIPENVTVVDNKEGIKYFLRAKYVFFCFGKYPIKPGKGQVVVNLWHGIPLKRLGNKERGKENIDYNFFTHLLTCSEYYRQIMKDCFGCLDNQILICGQPRCDRLFKDMPAVDSRIRKKARLFFVWIPTYRYTKEDLEEKLPEEGEEKQDRWPLPLLSKEELKNLDEILGDNETRMAIKLHPLQVYNEYEFEELKLKNIEVVSEKDLVKRDINVYDLCRASDGLITDYSSIYFDYLLLNRPIGFTVSDMRSYSIERGFLLEPAVDYMPGDLLKSYDDMVDYIKKVAEGKEEHEPDRLRVNHLVNYYRDGENCKRVLWKLDMDYEYNPQNVPSRKTKFAWKRSIKEEKY